MKQEVNKAFRGINKGKSPEEDGFTTDMFKREGDKVNDNLPNSYQSISGRKKCLQI